MIAYFDIFSGISGDMTLGALVDLGVPVQWIESRMKSINLPHVKIISENIKKNGITGKNIFVKSPNDPLTRNFSDIKKIISDSPFSDRVKKLSLAAFKKIAVAEARIHSEKIENIHFHEVGSVDAIVDIIGSFLCIEYLGINEIHASEITLGSGFTRCSHGTLPVPSPATLEILKKVPVKGREAASGELVTPTGAAIITTLTSSFGKIPGMTINHVGYGAGKNNPDSEIPNLLRIITGEFNQAQNEIIFVIETTTDDMSQEFSGHLFKKLFAIGALDVCHIPVQMKKNRPGIRLEVLCRKIDLEKMIDLIFNESSTLGIRYYKANRIKLERRIITVNTKFGKMKAKKITNYDNTFSIQPEYEEMQQAAEKYKIPLKKVYNQVNLDINSLKL